ncbi:MAG: hypothetical protein WCF23_16510 [Candidatus Nitrosopolaris sp.]
MSTEIRKQELKTKINTLAQTVREPQQKFTKDDKDEMVERAIKLLKIQQQEPTRKNLENEVLRQTRLEAIKCTEQTIYNLAIRQFQDFVNRDCGGEPLKMIVESPYHDGGKITEDRVYTATYGHTPDYEQVIFDQLKKYNLVQDNSQLSDYLFLFPFQENKR